MSHRPNRRWFTAIVIAGAAVLFTVLLQQPAGAPPGDGSVRRQAQQSLSQSQAEQAARLIKQRVRVQDVQVAVRDGTAIIALRPEPGLDAADHRSMEREVAQLVPAEVDGIRQAFVTTDPNVYYRVRDLQARLREVQARTGPRTSDSDIVYVTEFADVLEVVEELPNHARGQAVPISR